MSWVLEFCMEDNDFITRLISSRRRNTSELLWGISVSIIYWSATFMYERVIVFWDRVATTYWNECEWQDFKIRRVRLTWRCRSESQVDCLSIGILSDCTCPPAEIMMLFHLHQTLLKCLNITTKDWWNKYESQSLLVRASLFASFVPMRQTRFNVVYC